MSELTILKPGTEVILLNGPRAVIVCAMIEIDHISYKVMWLNGQSLEEKWVAEFVLQKPNITEYIKVGFGAK